jgi:hypothetical protein
MESRPAATNSCFVALLRMFLFLCVG